MSEYYIQFDYINHRRYRLNNNTSDEPEYIEHLWSYLYNKWTVRYIQYKFDDLYMVIDYNNDLYWKDDTYRFVSPKCKKL